MICCQLSLCRCLLLSKIKPVFQKSLLVLLSYLFSFATKNLDLLQVLLCLAANHWHTLLIKCFMHTIAIRSVVGFCSPESVGALIRPNWFRLSFPSLTLDADRTQDTGSSRHYPSIDSQGINYLPVSHFVHWLIASIHLST